jgi:hypothetical protein
MAELLTEMNQRSVENAGGPTVQNET